MRMIWSSEGLRIWLVGTTCAGDPGFEGMAVFESKEKRATMEWQAYPIPAGYRVKLANVDSRRSSMYEGPTFNLALEVAQAIMRSL